MRLGEVGKADDGEEPMRLLVDGNDDEVLLEEVHILGPRGDSSVTLLGRRQLLIFLLVHRRQSLVEELTENVSL